MTVRTYLKLPLEAREIRKAVFIREQGFQNEFDEIDRTAVHLVLYDGELPVATCRYFRDAGKQTYVAGRIAVVKSCRKKGCGKQILEEAERQIRALGEKRIGLSAQVQARGFYETLGYHAEGGVYYDESCPHVWMWKELKP